MPLFVLEAIDDQNINNLQINSAEKCETKNLSFTTKDFSTLCLCSSDKTLLIHVTNPNGKHVESGRDAFHEWLPLLRRKPERSSANGKDEGAAP